MSLVTLEELIDAGVHFGHRCSRWNPKMEQFIHGKRNSIHIIDLRETVKGLIRSTHFLEKVVGAGNEVLIVGTKPQLKKLVKEEAARCGQHYVAERWLGGTLTNYQTIRSRLKRLEEIETLETSDEYKLYSKKMISSLNREKRKLLRNLEGIRKMNRLPAAVVIVDPRREHIALSECHKMGIPSVCIIDTDSDPSEVDIPIPGNDDAFRSVQVMLTKIVDAIKRGKAKVDAARGITAGRGAPAPARTEQPVLSDVREPGTPVEGEASAPQA
ncbi:MAG TPA: 30S ribosomal protein S2 [Planctomycetota bacterium]|nr:30S ribosomal protein S2 [Planctomycetota bacterium]